MYFLSYPIGRSNQGFVFFNCLACKKVENDAQYGEKGADICFKFNTLFRLLAQYGVLNTITAIKDG